MNAVSILILAVIGGLFLLAVRHIRKNRNSCGCSGCTGCGSCTAGCAHKDNP